MTGSARRTPTLTPTLTPTFTASLDATLAAAPTDVRPALARPGVAVPVPDTLAGFAYLTAYWVESLLQRVAPEPWGEASAWLEAYVHANFTLAVHQGLLHHDPQGRYVLWRVGTLVTTDGRPIYGYFVANARRPAPPFFLVGFVTLDDGILRYQTPARTIMPIRIVAPPASPAYDPPSYPAVLPTLHWQHVLESRRDRIRARLPGLPDRALRWVIAGALADAHRASHRAVPAWRDGAVEWLLPLHVTAERPADEAPDFVAPVRLAEDGQGHVIPTLLEPWMAYPHARAVAPDAAAIRTWVTLPA